MIPKTIIGIDLAKHVFQVCIVNHKGTLKTNTTVPRGKLLGLIARQPPALIVMEACSGAHDWTRRFRAVGHEVRLLAPQYGSLVLPGIHNSMIFMANKECPYKSSWIL
jgi:transposase